MKTIFTKTSAPFHVYQLNRFNRIFRVSHNIMDIPDEIIKINIYSPFRNHNVQMKCQTELTMLETIGKLLVYRSDRFRVPEINSRFFF